MQANATDVLKLENADIQSEREMARMFFLMIVMLASGFSKTFAEDTTEAVQILSKQWKGVGSYGEQAAYASAIVAGAEYGFVGDNKTFKRRTLTYNHDGTVSVATSEAPFQYLEVDSDPVLFQGETFKTVVGVRCLFGRDCIFTTKPADADNVRRALDALA